LTTAPSTTIGICSFTRSATERSRKPASTSHPPHLGGAREMGQLGGQSAATT
jgi:hypothetical protein